MFGLLLTLLYLLTAYLSPVTVFGDLAQFRIELILALLTVVASLPKLQHSEILRSVQSYALPGLVLATGLSIAVNGWLGGAAPTMLEFVPNVAVFFFVAINCRTRKHLFALVAVILFAAIFVIAHAAHDIQVNDPFSQYLIRDRSNTGEVFFRIRGLALINDPNDFAQFLVGLTPCVFFFWRKGSYVRNFFFAIFPACILVYGLFLTHSRGGMLALLALVLMAFRRKIGTVPAAVIAGVLFLGFSAIGWSGGREISASSGADRMGAWSTGLIMLRTHPLLGVGLGRFQDFYEITAHNTIIVCSAETGLLGYFCWMMFVLPSVRDAVTGSGLRLHTRKEKGEDSEGSELVSKGDQAYFAPVLDDQDDAAAKESFLSRDEGDSLLDEDTGKLYQSPDHGTGDSETWVLPDSEDAGPEEVQRLCRIMLLSITGFLTAGWFLSRAFVLSLYLIGGMIAVVYRMARHHGAPEPLRLSRAAKLSALACLVSLAFVYVLLRVTNLVQH